MVSDFKNAAFVAGSLVMVPYVHGYAFALAEVLLSCHLILHKDQIRYGIKLDELTYQKPPKNYYTIPDDKCIGQQIFFKL